MRLLYVMLLGVASAVGLLWAGQFGIGPFVIVNEYEYRIPLLAGAPWRAPLDRPGMTWRIPLVESMESLDKRLQFLDADPVEMLVGSETLIVDYYAIWRIIDPLAFKRSYPGGMGDAQISIQRRLKSRVGATIGKMPLEQVLARARVIEELGGDVTKQLTEKGIEVIDVRINRTELPPDAEAAAYNQMREQRRAISREHRAKGEREARQIRAQADRKARTMLAEARAEAEVTRGEGDATAAAIYAAAYQREPEFYAFVRSLEAYRNTLGARTTMVLPPDHAFFRFLDPSVKLVRPVPRAEEAAQ
jgi:membrane protease subunit HflC